MGESDYETAESRHEEVIRHFFLAQQPDLHENFVRSLLDNRNFRRAERQGRVFSDEELRAGLDELDYLLRNEEFHQSPSHPRILAFVVVAALLRRAGLASTRGIKEFCLYRDSNVAMYMDHIRAHLGKCNQIPHGSVRIVILGKTYCPDFVPVAEAAGAAAVWSVRSKKAEISIYANADYNRHIAYAIRHGQNVAVFARTGQRVLDDEMPWSIIKSSTSSASLTISLNDPAHATDPVDRETIVINEERLRRRCSMLTNKVRATVAVHDGIPLNIDLTLIGDEELLVTQETEVGRSVAGLRRSCSPLFHLFLGLIPQHVRRMEFPHV